MKLSHKSISLIVTTVTLGFSSCLFAEEMPPAPATPTPSAVPSKPTTLPPAGLSEAILKNKPPAPPTMAPPDIGQLRERLELLNEFLALPPEKLARIRQTVESIEKMSPEEREKLSKAVGQFFKMHPDQQQSLARRFEKLTPADRELIREHWLKLSPQERDAERQRLQQLTPSERTAFELELVAKLRAIQAQYAPHFAPATTTKTIIVEGPVNNKSGVSPDPENNSIPNPEKP
ncbi:MAG: DUF3106 domain-containing protein [Verrucomicrobiota bacterium]|nr:DUF3106 domain-containing protein [Verrucomicrobiota bacterium]